MWDKGAIVIIRRGDDEFGRAITEGVTQQMQLVPLHEVANLERDYKFLKSRDQLYWKRKIARANRLYSTPIPRRPKWMRPFQDIWYLIVYGISVFADKYMTIHEE